jgi:hypothetical protein
MFVIPVIEESGKRGVFEVIDPGEKRTALPTGRPEWSKK